MKAAPRHPRRRHLPIFISIALAASVTAGLANAAAAAARKYVPTVTPTCVVAGSTVQLTATIKNSTSSTQVLGSAKVDSDEHSGFRSIVPGTAVSSNPAKRWSVTRDNDDDGIYLKASSSGNALSPGESVTATFTAKAPSSTGALTWYTSAWQGTSLSNGGFSLDTGASSPVTQVSSTCVGPPFKLLFNQQPGSAQAGASIGTIKVQVLDASNNLVTNATNQVTLALSDPGNPPATLSGTDTATPSGGVATFSGLSVNRVGTYTLSATATGLGPDTSASFTITAGSPAEVAFVAPDVTSLASGSARNFLVNVLDAHGNLTGYSGEIDFDQTAGSGTVLGLPDHTVVASGGEATSHDITGQLVGPVTVQASAPGIAGTDSATFNVVAGTASRVVLVSPDTTDLKSGFTRNFTVNVLDANDNLTGYSGEIDFTKLSGTGTVSGLPDAVNASGGVATSHDITGLIAGSVDVQASAPGIAGTDSATFNVVAGNPSKVVLVSPDTTDLKSGFTRNFTVNVLDANDNLTGYSGEIDFDQTAGSGTVLGLPDHTVVASGGVATSHDITAIFVGSVTVRASAPSVAGTDSTTFAVVAGTPYSLAFVQQPSQQPLPTVEGQPMDLVEVQVLDWQNQPVGGGWPVTVVIDSNPGGGTLTGVAMPQSTGSNGAASFNGLVIDKASSGYTLKACTPDCTLPTNPSVISDPFMISTLTTTDCQLGEGCQASAGPSTVTPEDPHSVTVDVPPIPGSTDTGNLVLTVETDQSVFPDCGVGNLIGYTVTIVPPPGYTAANPITVTFKDDFSTLGGPISPGIRPICKIVVDAFGSVVSTTTLDQLCSGTVPVPCIEQQTFDLSTGTLTTVVDITSDDPIMKH